MDRYLRVYIVYTEIHSRYFCLTPFVRGYNNSIYFKCNMYRFSSGKAEGEGFVARIAGKIIIHFTFILCIARDAPDTDRISGLDSYGLS